MMDCANNTSVAPVSGLHGDPFTAFDRLPRRVRNALNEAVVFWCPLRTRQVLDRLVTAGIREVNAVTLVVAELRATDTHEVKAFSDEHHKRYGFATPHVRAKATIQRYGYRRTKPSPGRRPYRGKGAPS